MRVDIASILGIAIGLSAILLGNMLEGGHIAALFQPTALLIVVGGTVGATLLGFPLPVFVRAIRALRDVFSSGPQQDNHALIEEIVDYAQKARREGIIALEKPLEESNEPYLKKALLLAVDGADSKSMRDNLELIIEHYEDDKEQLARVWEAAGGYAPTIGIIGAVLGLIHVMQSLADVNAVGKGIAVAFVATIYGVSFANLLLLPVAAKLKHKLREETKRLELMMEGALAIQEGMNPSLIREKLSSFYQEERKKNDASSVSQRAPVRT
ncbi:MAG TPA: flagellar motor protein [Polyangiales bacterium]|nr:flagellar motor protein [Polyangiales bacterium]